MDNLNDYDILGVDKNSTFYEIKNMYHLLSKYYHPDSTCKILGISNLTKIEKEIAFNRINHAYSNLKEKLKVIEIDMPREKINYETDYEIPIIKKCNELDNIDFKNFNEKFNEIFEKVQKEELSDEPYSIYYKEPNKENRNMSNSLIAIREYEQNTINNYEFGINYIEDHSSNKYIDTRQLINKKIENKLCQKIDIDCNLEDNLNNYIKIREMEIKLTEKEIQEINKNKELTEKIFESKKNIEKSRKNNLYLH